jgi:hypothetical protein
VKLFENKTVPDLILAVKKAFERLDTSNFNYPKIHFLHHIGETIRRTGAPELVNSGHFEQSHKRCVRAVFLTGRLYVLYLVCILASTKRLTPVFLQTCGRAKLRGLSVSQ